MTADTQTAFKAISWHHSRLDGVKSSKRQRQAREAFPLFSFSISLCTYPQMSDLSRNGLRRLALMMLDALLKIEPRTKPTTSALAGGWPFGLLRHIPQPPARHEQVFMSAGRLISQSERCRHWSITCLWFVSNPPHVFASLFIITSGLLWYISDTHLFGCCHQTLAPASQE